MKIEELKKRDLKKDPLLVIDKSLERFKSFQIPKDKVESANEMVETSNFYEVFPNLKKNNKGNLKKT